MWVQYLWLGFCIYITLGELVTMCVGYSRRDLGAGLLSSFLLHVVLWPAVLVVCHKWHRFGGHDCGFHHVSDSAAEY